ncbi:MAG: hypothetical protein Q8Q08_10370 [Candidatus Omnitrophota bacterium]|nr:hypothetical protein [Candidatus Omnitrophota bacterium]MDZ4242886.1 hypothetical protein [Candidatus Omnitrophota bacterium]
MKNSSSYFLPVLCCLTLGLLAGLSLVHLPAVYRVFVFMHKNALDVSFTGFSVLTVIYLAVNYLTVAFFGYRLSHRLYRYPADMGRGLQVLASFFVGFLCTIGLLRVMTLFVPYKQIYWPTMVVIGILMFFHRPDSPRNGWRGIFAGWKRFLSARFLCVGVILTVFFVYALLHQVRFADFIWVGHGPYQYAYLHNMWDQAALSHFPVLSKHYDELIFHYWLLSPIQWHFNPILPWWVTLGVIKVSAWVFLFSIFRNLGASNVLSLVMSLFLFLGTTSLDPTKYYLIFDSANLLFFCAHSGRVVGPVLVLMMLAEIFAAPGERKPFPWVFFLLAGLGLTATSCSNVFWLLMVEAVLLISWVAYRRPYRLRDEPWSGTLICYLSVAACLLLYGMAFDGRYVYAARLAAVAAVLLILFFRMAVRGYGVCVNWDRAANGRLLRLAVLGAAMAAGMIFLGNLFVENRFAVAFLKFLGKFLGEIPFQPLSPGFRAPMEPVETGGFALGDYREVATYNEYCLGLLQFVGYYGMILAAILTTNYFFVSGAARTPLSRADGVIYDVFLMAAAVLPFFLFFMDFVKFGTRAWLKSRFLEGPVYLILFAMCYAIVRFGSRVVQGVAVVLFCVYMLVPFVATERHRQILHNWNLLIEYYQDNRDAPGALHGK